MTVVGAQETITHAVTSWEGVTVQPHRFGGMEYVMGRREIGQITFWQNQAGLVFICASRRMWGVRLACSQKAIKLRADKNPNF